MTARGSVTAPRKKAPVRAEVIAQEIAIGRHDSALTDLSKVVQERALALGQITMWRLDLGDLHVTESELTLGESVRLEEEMGVNWMEMPRPLQSAAMCRALLVLLLQTRLSLPADEAQTRADALTVEKLMAAFTGFFADPGKG